MAPKGLEPSVSNVQHVLFWSLHVLPLAIFYMRKKPAPSFWLGTHPFSIGVGTNLADYHLKVWSCLIQWRCLSCRVSVFLEISDANISKRLFRVPPVISKGNSSYIPRFTKYFRKGFMSLPWDSEHWFISIFFRCTQVPPLPKHKVQCVELCWLIFSKSRIVSRNVAG